MAFDIKPPSTLPFIFTGVRFRQHQGSFTLDMHDYITREVTALTASCKFAAYSSMRAKLLWCANVRPELCCAVSIFAATTISGFTELHVTEMNVVIHRLRSTSSQCLRFPALDASSLRLHAYSDSSFSNRPDDTLQLGFVLCLVDSSKRACIIAFQSYQARRKCRSSMTAETLALIDVAEAAIAQQDLDGVLHVQVPILLFTDSQCLFEIVTGGGYTTEKRLNIDLDAVREAEQRQHIANIALLASAANPADSLTELAPVVRRNSVTVNLKYSKCVRHVCRPTRYSGLFCHTLAYELGCTVMRRFRQCSVEEDLLANCELSTRAF